MEDSPLLAAAPASSRRSSFAASAFAALGSTIVVVLALAGYYEHAARAARCRGHPRRSPRRRAGQPEQHARRPTSSVRSGGADAAARVLRVASCGRRGDGRLTTAADGRDGPVAQRLVYVVSSAYGPADGSAVSPLRAATVTLDAANGWSAELPLFRLRPSKTSVEV